MTATDKTAQIEALRESGALAEAHLLGPDDQTAQAVADFLGLAFRTHSGRWQGASVSLVREIGDVLAALAAGGGAPAVDETTLAMLHEEATYWVEHGAPGVDSESAAWFGGQMLRHHDRLAALRSSSASGGDDAAVEGKGFRRGYAAGFAHGERASGGVSTLDLYAIEKRANAATEGPWHGPHDEFGCVSIGDYGWVCGGTSSPEYGVDSDQGKADAEFIAHAREDVPALLDEVDRLSDTVVFWKQEVEASNDRAGEHLDRAVDAEAEVRRLSCATEPAPAAEYEYGNSVHPGRPFGYTTLADSAHDALRRPHPVRRAPAGPWEPVPACRICTPCAHSNHDRCAGHVTCPADGVTRVCSCCGGGGRDA